MELDPVTTCKRILITAVLIYSLHTVLIILIQVSSGNGRFYVEGNYFLDTYPKHFWAQDLNQIQYIVNVNPEQGYWI